MRAVVKNKMIQQEPTPRRSELLTTEKDIQDMLETSKAVDQKDYHTLLSLF